MIIVSQDRIALINFDNAVGIQVIDKILEAKCIDCNYKITLGTYKTEERAKEVLQEIIQNIYPKSNVDMDIYGISFGVQSPVYEMPLE